MVQYTRLKIEHRNSHGGTLDERIVAARTVDAEALQTALKAAIVSMATDNVIEPGDTFAVLDD